MKKVLIIFALFLSACTQKPQYYLYLYYAQTCPICHAFIDDVIPELEEEYGRDMQIIKFDIDEESSRDAYAKTASMLEGYYVTDDSGSVPFIVLDGYFAKVGYDVSEKEEMITAIRDAIEGKSVTSRFNEVYDFQEGMTFH